MRNQILIGLLLLGQLLLSTLETKAEVVPEASEQSAREEETTAEPSDSAKEDEPLTETAESFGLYTIMDAPPPPEPQQELENDPKVGLLESQVLALSQRVDYFCKVPHDSLVKIPRIESNRELEASLEIARSYEQPDVYAKPGEPVLVQFPNKVRGGYKRSAAGIAIERSEDYLVLFVEKSLNPEGEALLVQTEDLNFYAFRVKLASAEHKADVKVKLSASQ